MQVILLERIERLGQMGDVVTVKDGYARNFLLPQKKALRSTEENRKRFEGERVQLEAQNLEHRNEAQAVGEKLDGRDFVVIRQASESGQLYGSVTTRDISAQVSEDGVLIARNQVFLDAPIKTLGLHSVKIVLHPEVSANVIVNVARNPEEAQRQTRGEDVDAEQVGEEETLVAEEIFEDEERARHAESELAADAQGEEAEQTQGVDDAEAAGGSSDGAGQPGLTPKDGEETA